MNFLKFVLLDGRFRLSSYNNDEYLSMLAYPFSEDSFFLELAKQDLFENKRRTITGNKTYIKINKDDISIMPLYGDDNEEHVILINRQVLLQLIDSWQDLVSKNAQEITLIRYDDGLITMSGKFEAEK